MAITKREICYKEQLITLSYRYLYNQLQNNSIKPDVKLQIALAMARAGVARDVKIQHSGEVGVVVSFADFLKEAGVAAENRIADLVS